MLIFYLVRPNCRGHKSAFLFVQSVIDNRSVSQISIASLIGVNKGVFSPMVFIGNHFLAFKGFAIVIFINTVPVKVKYYKKLFFFFKITVLVT